MGSDISGNDTYLFSTKQWFEFYSRSIIEFKKILQLVEQIPWRS